jgi:hypothetical protein
MDTHCTKFVKIQLKNLDRAIAGAGSSFLAPRNNVQHAIRQRPLQFQRLDGLALQPEIELLSCGQDHGDGFGMDKRDNRSKTRLARVAFDRNVLWDDPDPVLV